MPKSLAEQVAELQKAILAQESLRGVIADDVIDTALLVLRNKLLEFERRQSEDRSREQCKLVTVMAADISGFTAPAEKLESDDMAETLKVFWARIEGIILSHGGHIDKHPGDSVVAFWGAQASRENDAEQAVRAALRIQQAVPGLSLQHPFKMKIALHSGPAMSGELGEIIQVAALFESCAAAGEVVISQETQHLVRGLFDIEPCGEVPALEGRPALLVYRILRARPHAFRPRTRGVEGVETRMVGRDLELASLQEHLLAAISGQKPVAVTVLGEAGIGKSRLLFEFENWLEVSPQNLWILEGRATERTMHVPYALIRDAIALRLEIPDNAPLETARGQLVRALLGLLPDDPGALEKAHFIGHLLGYGFADSPSLSGIISDPSQIRDQARFYLTQVVAAIAARQPVLLLFEDLHWADEASLDLLAYLMREVGQKPVFVLGLARPTLLERLPDWWERIPGQQRLELAPLTETASRVLVREILQKAASVPKALDELVVAGAEGNPFYVEELIKMLIGDHIIVTGAAWTVDVSRLGNIRVPPTLTGILQARLDGLPEAERTVLQAASALGRVFWDGALGAFATLSSDEVSAALERLEARELVFFRKNSSFRGQREYVFKHALLQQVTYETVLKRQRRQYHLRAADWLMKQSGERAQEYAASIAAHFEHAEDENQAASWYALAGKQAYDAYVPDSAVTYYKKALRLSRQHFMLEKDQLEWYENLGKSYFALTHYDDALNAYQEMRAAAERTANIDGLALAWYHISYVHDHIGNNALSLESAENALRLADRGANLETLIKAFNGKGWALYRMGEASHSVELGEKSLRLARTLDDPIVSQREMGQAYQLLGAAYELRGNLPKSQDCEARALELFRGLRNRRGEAAMLNNQGVGAFVRSDYDAAIARYEQALSVAREIGSHDRESIFLSNLGGARIGKGDYVAAELDLRQSIDSLGAKVTHFLPLTYVFLAEALLGQTRVDEACEAAQQGLKLAQDTEQPDVISSAYRTLGNCGTKRIQIGMVLPASFHPPVCYQESLRIATELRSDADKARTLRAWASYEKAFGDPQKADSMRAEALALFTKLDMPLEVERTS